jgi:transposase InsO family protein
MKSQLAAQFQPLASIRLSGSLLPSLLSDNGPSYIAGELAEYIEAQKMSHVRGAPLHPQTQIERWHQTLKNRILLENYFLPGDLETQFEAFARHYNGTYILV